MLLWAILFFLVLGLALVRVLPSDPNVWHQEIRGDHDKDMAGGAIRVLVGAAANFEKLDQIAISTPRTKRIAGSASEQRVTYETRSKWIGFPDYTTVELSGDDIKLFARLRFGLSDLGVNKTRLESWIDQLKN